jgi:hypothetical protein
VAALEVVDDRPREGVEEAFGILDQSGAHGGILRRLGTRREPVPHEPSEGLGQELNSSKNFVELAPDGAYLGRACGTVLVDGGDQAIHWRRGRGFGMSGAARVEVADDEVLDDRALVSALRGGVLSQAAKDRLREADAKALSPHFRQERGRGLRRGESHRSKDFLSWGFGQSTFEATVALAVRPQG